MIGRIVAQLLSIPLSRRVSSAPQGSTLRTSEAGLPWDTGGRYGGVGGHEHFGTPSGTTRRPIVFVHGLTRDATDWARHWEYFLSQEAKGDDLWAITFRLPYSTHDEMAGQLDEFIARVRRETGADTVNIVAHSLGVTGVRHWLHRDQRHDWVETFVGIAGANHGLHIARDACMLGFVGGLGRPAPYLRSDYESVLDHPLQELNTDETPGDIEYFTIRGAHDELFAGCRESPQLDGATNIRVEEDHDGARTSDTTLRYLDGWLN